MTDVDRTTVAGTIKPSIDTPVEISGVTLDFGGLRALDNVSFRVSSGETYGVIGPNGAGKTSLLNCLNGAYVPSSGSIKFFGTDVVTMRPHQIAALGITRTFQTISLMPERSVLENILVGTHTRSSRNLFASLVRIGTAGRQERQLLAEVEPIIEMLELSPFAARPAGLLPVGTQRRVEIARGIASRARVIVYDEPTSGMNSDERAEMGALIRSLQQSSGLTQLIVEHDAKFMNSVCDRMVVLNFGRVIAEGEPDAVFSDPAVVEAYLGKRENAHRSEQKDPRGSR